VIFITHQSAVGVVKSWVDFFGSTGCDPRWEHLITSGACATERFSESKVYFIVSGLVLKVGWTGKNPKFRIQEHCWSGKKRKWAGRVVVYGATQHFEYGIHLLLKPWIHRFTPKSREYFKRSVPVESLLVRLETLGEQVAA
jgi:hypothetical protein